MYALPPDMRAARPERDLIQLTDPTGAAVDDAKLGQALQDAAALIDGYLASRYPVPVIPAPDVLRVCALDIAFYRLHLAVSPAVAPDVRQQYEDRIAWLTAIAHGKADLAPPRPADSGVFAPAADVAFDVGAPVFSRHNLWEY